MVANGPTRRRLLSALCAAGAAAAAGRARAEFRLEVSGVGATQLPIAISTFGDEERATVPVSQVVRADLERSGLFRVMSGPAGLDERSAPAFAALRAQGADALVVGSVQRLADGRVDTRFSLWDSVKREELLSGSKVVLGPDLRLAAHRIADDIQLKLTGERGVFATRIAYVVRTGRNYQLLVTDADGEGGQAALTSREPIISPAWSPDGKRLAYVSFETQKASVWTQDLQSGRRRMVADYRGSNSAPAWSPDGRTLALALSRDGLTQLYTMPAEGGTPVRLARSDAIDTEPVYSADGRYLYFTSDRGGGPQIYRMSAGGGAAERMTFSGNYNISASLSADGRYMAYVTRQGNAFKLMLMELETQAVRALTDSGNDEHPSFAPNSRMLVYATRGQGTGVLMTTTLDGRKSRLSISGSDVREPAWGPFGR
ncbi:MAG: Tol-Pal system protein TolB [Burkholderiales bacterium]|nr:Tol-Pal system protein TolB [Burkholderiales bacterium]